MTRVPLHIRKVTTKHTQIDRRTGKEVACAIGHGTETYSEAKLCATCVRSIADYEEGLRPRVVGAVNREHIVTSSSVGP